jgi:DNA-binding transcriptional regulator LsrR (DeoR family)
VALAAQVMALVAHGRSQRQIADALGISRTTVQRYLKKAVKQ